MESDYTGALEDKKGMKYESLFITLYLFFSSNFICSNQFNCSWALAINCFSIEKKNTKFKVKSNQSNTQRHFTSSSGDYELPIIYRIRLILIYVPDITDILLLHSLKKIHLKLTRFTSFFDNAESKTNTLPYKKSMLENSIDTNNKVFLTVKMKYKIINMNSQLHNSSVVTSEEKIGGTNEDTV